MMVLIKTNNLLGFIKDMLGIKVDNLYGNRDNLRRLRKTMKNLNLNDFDNIKVIYDRIPNDNKNLKVTILWKPELDLKYSENISVYAEAGTENRNSIDLCKVEDTNVWIGEIEIMKLYSELHNFEKNLSIKLVECTVIPYNKNLSFAY